ncbi:MAG: DASS family divalent anion:Na+ symporter, partial [Planctomycetota bacterium]
MTTASKSDEERWDRARWLRLAGCLLVGFAVFLSPRPEAVEPEGWRVLAIFVTVIAGFILRPFPMGPMVLFGVVACAATSSLELDQALSGYGEKVVWLVVGAFLLAGTVRDTGLGRRAALLLVMRFGKSILGVAYAQAAAELLLGPLVPSNTARGGGILAPISDSLSRALGAKPGDDSNKAGAFLSLVGAHCNLITAAMFLTGMAANPLFAAAARDIYDAPLDDWSTWALAMIVPGLIALGLMPLLIYKLIRPENTDGRPAQELARRELEALGPWSRAEKILAAVFGLMIFLWSVKAWGPAIGLNLKPDTTMVTLLGVTVLLATG